MEGLEAIFAEDAIVAHALDLEEPAVGRETDFAQLGQIGQTFADPEVIGVVDRRLAAQSPVFLVILLDARRAPLGFARFLGQRFANAASRPRKPH
jgi:hypothetical protein